MRMGTTVDVPLLEYEWGGAVGNDGSGEGGTVGVVGGCHL
jgi:hypothetical protein